MSMFLLLFSIIFCLQTHHTALWSVQSAQQVLLYLFEPHNGLAQKAHRAALCSIANKDNLDGFFQNTLAALSHAYSINFCFLELDNVIRDNKHAAAMMLDTKSTISRGSKSKNFTIKGWHHCCLIFCWAKVMKKADVGVSVPSVFRVPCARCAWRGDMRTGEAQEQVIR